MANEFGIDSANASVQSQDQTGDTLGQNAHDGMVQLADNTGTPAPQTGAPPLASGQGGDGFATNLANDIVRTAVQNGDPDGLNFNNGVVQLADTTGTPSPLDRRDVPDAGAGRS